MTTNILRQAGSGTEGRFELFIQRNKHQQFQAVSFNDETAVSNMALRVGTHLSAGTKRRRHFLCEGFQDFVSPK